MRVFLICQLRLGTIRRGAGIEPKRTDKPWKNRRWRALRVWQGWTIADWKHNRAWNQAARFSRWIPWVSRHQAISSDAPRKNHTTETRHLARSILGVGPADHCGSVV